MDPSQQTPTRAVPLVVPPTSGVDQHPAVYPTSEGPTYADLPAAPASYRPDDGPTGRRRRHKAPLAWLPWALLAAIVAIALLAWLFSALADGSDKASPASSGAARAATAANGKLTSQGADLTAGGAALKSHVGQAATGRAVAVQSVVSDEGFWVGSGASDRVFVHLSPAARGGQGESPFQVRAGQHIDLTGNVAPFSGQDFGVSAREGLGQLRTQGAYVEATSVRLSS